LEGRPSPRQAQDKFKIKSKAKKDKENIARIEEKLLSQGMTMKKDSRRNYKEGRIA